MATDLLPGLSGRVGTSGCCLPRRGGPSLGPGVYQSNQESQDLPAIAFLAPASRLDAQGGAIQKECGVHPGGPGSIIGPSGSSSQSPDLTIRVHRPPETFGEARQCAPGTSGTSYTTIVKAMKCPLNSLEFYHGQKHILFMDIHP